jgi:hypothetical protein
MIILITTTVIGIVAVERLSIISFISPHIIMSLIIWTVLVTMTIIVRDNKNKQIEIKFAYFLLFVLGHKPTYLRFLRHMPKAK